MTNEMTHFIKEAIQRIADEIRGEWGVKDEAFLKDIISDGLAPLRVEIENFEAIERERDLLKEEVAGLRGMMHDADQAFNQLFDSRDTIANLRERLAAAEAMIHYAVPIVIHYAKANPRWVPESWSPIRGQQDPNGAHVWLDRYDAVWKSTPEAQRQAELRSEGD